MTHTRYATTTIATTTRYPFLTTTDTSAHTGKDYDECLYYVRYDNSFIDDLWMGGLEGDLKDKEYASLYTLADAKALALEAVNMDPSFDSNGRVIEALTWEMVFDGADYLCVLIAREVCYSLYGNGLRGMAQRYEWVASYSELLELNKEVDSKNV